MSRYTTPRRHFHWTPEELIAIWKVGTTLRTDNEMAVERRFPSGEQLLRLFRKNHPEIVTRYEEKMEQPLLPKVVYDRLHKNYYGDLVNGRSPEHPHRHVVKQALLQTSVSHVIKQAKVNNNTYLSEGGATSVSAIEIVDDGDLKDLFSWSVERGKVDLALRIAEKLLK